MHNLHSTTASPLKGNWPRTEPDGILHEMRVGQVSAIRQDRCWFQTNPSAIVRFRSASEGEFTPLQAIGAVPPSFRPSFCRVNAPLSWVAVVDLMRLAGSPSTQPDEPTVRLRLQIPAIRSAKRQQKAKAELLDAIAAELLEGLESEQNPIAA